MTPTARIDYGHDQAQHAMRHSNDPRTQIGCILLDHNGALCAWAHNRIYGAEQHPERLEADAKGPWSCHAEIRAIADPGNNHPHTAIIAASRPTYPCSTCAMALVAAGVRVVIVDPLLTPDGCPDGHAWDDPRYRFDVAETVFREAGVEVRGW